MKTAMTVAMVALLTTAGVAMADEPFELDAAQLDGVTAGIALLLPAVQAAREAARDNADAAPVLVPAGEFLLLNAGPDLDLSPPGLPTAPRQ